MDEHEVRLPLRVNWGGGWSDTPPYCNENGGTVLNAAILLNGEEMATLTSTDGPTVLSFKNALPENALRFSYVAGAGDVGGALVGAIGIVPPQGMFLSFR